MTGVRRGDYIEGVRGEGTRGAMQRGAKKGARKEGGKRRRRRQERSLEGMKTHKKREEGGRGVSENATHVSTHCFNCWHLAYQQTGHMASLREIQAHTHTHTYTLTHAHTH